MALLLGSRQTFAHGSPEGLPRRSHHISVFELDCETNEWNHKTHFVNHFQKFPSSRQVITRDVLFNALENTISEIAMPGDVKWWCKWGVVACTCNPSTGEAKTGGLASKPT